MVQTFLLVFIERIMKPKIGFACTVIKQFFGLSPSLKELSA
jgi:hypothetical protein